MSADDLNQLLERHRVFWKGEGDTPLRRVGTHSPMGGHGSIPLADGTRAAEGQYITPELIDPRSFYPEESGARTTALSGDFMAGAGPPHLCWTEAAVGCPVRVVTGGPWADPFISDWADLDAIVADEGWLEKLDAFVDFLAQRAAGSYPIVQPLMRGPIDMMTFALGHERMCFALMESPQEAKALLSICADIFIQAAQRRLDHTPPFAGGYLSGFGIWAPGTVVRNQVDNATLISPAVYQEQVFEHDLRVMEAFDFSVIHLHSGCLHIIDTLLAAEAPHIIQVSIDFPGGPLAAEIMPILEKILQKKPLIVTGPVTPAELQDLEALSPPGRLCIQVAKIEELT